MALLPTRLDAGEDYATLDDLRACADRAELTVKIPAWKKGGKPLALRVRQLDLAQIEDIRMRAGRAVAPEDRARGITQHHPTFVVATIQAGVIAPAMDWDQAQFLLRKNRAACEQLSSFIIAISAIDQGTIDAVIAALAAEDGVAAEGPAGDPPPPDADESE